MSITSTARAGLGVIICASLWAQSGETAYKEGASLYRSSNCAAAIPELQTAVSTSPRASLLLARCLFDAGQYAPARDAIAHYRESAGAEMPAAILHANILEKSGQGEAAAALLEEFLRKNPEAEPLRSVLADVYLSLGKDTEANQHYKIVLDQYPDDPGAHLNAGLQAARNQRWTEAIQHFQKARQVVPNHARTLSALGNVYLQLGKCDEAIEPLRAALLLEPDNFLLAKSLAVCLDRAGKWNDVLATLRTGTSEEAADEAAAGMVVKAYRSINDAPGIEVYCSEILAVAPANVTARLALADHLYASGRQPKAREHYLEAVKARPDLPEINERLGDMCKDKEARAFYEAAAKSKTAPDSARLKLAKACYEAGDLDCVRGSLAAITATQMERDVKTLLSQTEFKASNWALAGSLAAEALALDPSNVALLQIAGKCAQRQDKPQAAAELLERALKQDPRNPELRYELAALYSDNETLNRLPRAVEILSEYLNAYKKEPEAYLLLGNVYRRMKDLDNARLNFAAGFQLLTPPVDPRLSWAFNSYAAVLVELKQFADAYGYETQGVQLNPKDDLAWFNLAVICSHLGKTDELKAAQTKLAELKSPLADELEKALAPAGRRKR